jgi:hypothetical protein
LDLPTLSARPPERSFHLIFESYDGRAYVPIPKRSASPRAISTPQVNGLKALDPNRPIREADMGRTYLRRYVELLFQPAKRKGKETA